MFLWMFVLLSLKLSLIESLLKGDIEYLEMSNQWILTQFANPNDLFLVREDLACPR